MVELTILKEHRLDKKQLKKIKAFVEQNNAEQGLPEFFYWDAIEHRIERKVPLDWLCYINGQLIAYVAIYYFDGNVLDINISLLKEVSQYSHDICKQIYESLHQTFGRYRIYATVFKINFENKLLTNALADLGATVVGMSKYLQRDIDAPAFDSTVLTVKQANKKHLETLAEIQEACFAINKSQYLEFLKDSSDNKNRKAYLFYLGSDVIGKIHVLHSDKQILIEDLCVVPAMQDQNYELAMLQEICNLARNSKSLLVEIDSDYENLFKLYSQLDFYEVAIIHNYDRDLNFAGTP